MALTSDIAPGKGPFPESFTPEEDLPSYATYRTEGRTIAPSVRAGLTYIEKWFRKKYSAPLEEKPYFDHQRALMRLLSTEPPPAATSSVKLGLVGDLMWLRNGWDSFLSPEVLAKLNECDVLLGNLESPIARDLPVRSFLFEYAHYNSAPGLLSSFRRPDGSNSFTAVSTSNNHVLDMGEAGCRQTLEFLAEQKVPQSGVQTGVNDPPYVAFTSNGIRFGFFAAGWGPNGGKIPPGTKLQFNFPRGLAPEDNTPVELTLMEKALAAMTADQVDFKIIALHWNFEYEWYPTPKTMCLARRLVELGADLIIGHHPHVQQPYEVAFVNGAEERYRGDSTLLAAQPDHGCLLRDASGRPRKALIVYSLGNFTTKMSTFISQIGMLQRLVVTKDACGNVDWSSPNYQLVFNNRFDPAACGRRLVLLEDYLTNSGPTESEAFQAAFVHNHLLGHSIDLEQEERLGNLGLRQIGTNLFDLASFIYTSYRGI